MKRAEFYFKIVHLLSFMSFLVFAVKNGNPLYHWDIYNYFGGFQAINAGKGICYIYLNYFGRFPEVFFYLLYQVMSWFLTITNEKSLLIIHAIIFGAIYPIALKKFIFRFSPINNTIYNLGLIALILCLTLPGIPLQLARQSISFVIILYVVSSFSDFTFLPLILTIVIAAFLHLGSIVVPILLFAFLKFRNKVYFVLLLAGLSMLIHFSPSFYFLFLNIPSDIFYNFNLNHFFNLNLVIALILLLLLIIINVRFSISNSLSLILFLFSLILLIIYPIPFFNRLLYSFDFLVIPFSILTLKAFRHSIYLNRYFFLQFGMISLFLRFIIFSIV